MPNLKRCRIVALVLLLLFTLVGCSNFLRMAGFSETEIDTIQDDAAAAGQPGPRDSDALFWQATTAAMTVTGALGSSLLARWLRTEKRITRAVIEGLEETPNPSTKKNIAAKARSLGVGDDLHKRVKKIFP